MSPQRGASIRTGPALLGLIWAAALPHAAAAQRPEGGREPADTGAAIPLRPLIVTALGPRLTVLAAPYAVSVAVAPPHQPGPDLSLLPMLRGVPGVQVDDRANAALGDRISIRGFGARSQFGVRGVQVLLDGIPITLPDGQTTLSVVDPGFLERAEIVRGPASALYGNAAGGVILLQSQPAPWSAATAAVTAAAGADGLRRVEVNGGAGWDDGGIRTQIGAVHTDGYREYSRADVLRGHALATLAVLSGRLGLSFDGTTYDARNPGSLTDSLLAVDRRMAYGANVSQATGESGKQAQVGVRWSRSLRRSGPDLVAAAYVRGRSVDNPIPSSIIGLDRRLVGGRLSIGSGAGRFAWGASLQSALQSDARRNWENLGGNRGAPTLDQRERVALLALAARASAAVAGNVDVLAALRFDRVGFSVHDRLVSAGDPDDSGGRMLQAWSPTVGIRLGLLPTLSLYANVATAFETPTTSELANRPDGAGGFNPSLQPQRTTSVEAGAKGILASRLRYEVTVYHARVRDALVPFEVPDAPGREFFRNAGRTRHCGLETLLRANPIAGVGATAAFTWTDARFESYVLDGADLGGNRVPGVIPRRLELSLDVAAGGALQTLSATWASPMPVDDRNRARSPGYFVADYSLDLQPLALGSADIAPFVSIRNALDRAYNGSVVVNAFGARYYEPAPGRTLTLGANIRLGGPAGPS